MGGTLLYERTQYDAGISRRNRHEHQPMAEEAAYFTGITMVKTRLQQDRSAGAEAETAAYIA